MLQLTKVLAYCSALYLVSFRHVGVLVIQCLGEFNGLLSRKYGEDQAVSASKAKALEKA